MPSERARNLTPSINLISSNGTIHGLIEASHERNNGTSGAVPRTEFVDIPSKLEYNVPWQESYPFRRPALSRPPTQTNINDEVIQEDSEKKIQRTQTECYNSQSASSSLSESDFHKPPPRAHTDSIVGSGKSKRGPSLEDQITETMMKIDQIGLDEPKPYLPDEMLPKFLTSASIRKALPKVSDDLINFAEKNPKVLAITLLVYSDKKSRRRAMEAFRAHGFNDNCLPAEKMSNLETCSVQFDWKDSDDESEESDDDISPYCKHKPEGCAFHSAPWKQTSFRAFWEKQWSFLVPTILEEIFIYPFGDHIILPFIKDDVNLTGGGHFGDITHAKMLAKHQTAIETENDTIPVAIKQMKLHPGEEYDNFGNWEREVKALRTFNKLYDKHIIRGIGAFTQRSKYYILMEWADKGDLWNIYTKNPNPHLNLNGTLVQQFLEQFLGLANALNQMHDYKIVSNGNIDGMVLTKEQENEVENSIRFNNPGESPKPKTPAILVSEFENTRPREYKIRDQEGYKTQAEEAVAEGQEHHHGRKVHFQEPDDGTPKQYLKVTENWRHGDLKPANILGFNGDKSSWLGTLKLADLGRARQHMVKTARRTGTNENFSTVPYDPPEVWTSLTKGRSRLVDIWSFGCVLLESIIWLLFGFEELKRFLNRPTGFGSLYWTDESIHNKTAKLHESTFKWISELLKYDPECKAGRRASAMRDVILLIRDKLLVMKLPEDSDILEKECRINSKALVHELGTILQKGKDDPSYLFSGIHRADIQPPTFVSVRPTEQKNKSGQFLSADVQLHSRNVIQNPTPAPWAVKSGNDYGEGVDSYSHNFDDKWEYVRDEGFANKVIHDIKLDVDQLLPGRESNLCERCSLLKWNADTLEIKDSRVGLRKKEVKENCELCAMFLRIIDKIPHMDSVEFNKFGPGLRLNKSANLPVLNVRQISQGHEQTIGLTTDSSHIQTGIPKIPKGGDSAHFDIMRAWLEDCDENHKDCWPKRPKSSPTRLIDVGTLESPSLRLLDSSSLPKGEKDKVKYIALSHPWGKSPPHDHFVTNKQNVEIHKREIPNRLPKTLADAINTTRQLRVRYIWIDSLCIIQGSGGDFAQEADRMEAVFSSAYCVIAATSATGSSSGFLSRSSKHEFHAIADPEDRQQDLVRIHNRDAKGKLMSVIFITEPWDDFDADVLKSGLNQRGWVFQERALARRTIHFAANQTYWECGEGIRCESLTKMKNTRVGFLGDPNFPTYGLRGSKGGDIVFYEDLYEQYSKLSFTKVEDRPFAISGLEQRLIKALKEKGGSNLGYWGIFDDFWGRGLLWRRATDVQQMKRLTAIDGGGQPAPSWSWEGHSGGITFMKPDPHSVEWLSEEVILPWKRAQAPQVRMTTASYYGERCLRGVARNFRSQKKGQGKDTTEEDIIYDNDSDWPERGPLKCLIIGRMKMKDRSREELRNYVLVLAKKKGAAESVYERIGAGFLDGSLISFEQNEEMVLVE